MENKHHPYLVWKCQNWHLFATLCMRAHAQRGAQNLHRICTDDNIINALLIENHDFYLQYTNINTYTHREGHTQRDREHAHTTPTHSIPCNVNWKAELHYSLAGESSPN